MPETRITVLLIEDNPGDQRLIREFLATGQGVSFEVACTDRLSAGLAAVQRGSLDVILLDLTLPDSHGLDSFRRVRAAAGEIPIVILSGVEDDALAMQAVREGAQDYLVKSNIKAQSLVRVVRYACERYRARDGQDRAARSVPGRLVAVIGAKGGVGATTVAVNLAAAIVRQGQRAALLELGPGWAGLSRFLTAPPPATLSSVLAGAAGEITPDAIAPLLYRDPGGLQVLFGPQHPGEFCEIDPAKAEAIIGALRQRMDATIIDLPDYPSAANAAAVRQCDQVLMVLERLSTSVAAGTVVIEMLRGSLGPDAGVAAVLVNRAPLASPVDTTEIGAQLDCEVVVVVPNALEACLRAQKQGVPLVVAEPGLPASARFMQLAEWVMAQRPVAPRG
jgi:MinD-like ATPase involved in chromosome partitioning or flagellar assembly/FixJ family two-component response regulator